MKILQEITDWDFPNHIYHVSNKGKLVAYKNAVTGEFKTFVKPISFYRSRRKFKTLEIIND